MTELQRQWCTFAFIMVITFVVIAYDIAVIHHWGVNCSISRVFRKVFTSHPVAFAAWIFWLGVLVGHVWLNAVTQR